MQRRDLNRNCCQQRTCFRTASATIPTEPPQNNEQLIGVWKSLCSGRLKLSLEAWITDTQAQNRALNVTVRICVVLLSSVIAMPASQLGSQAAFVIY